MILDTHVWLWSIVAPDRLGPQTRTMLERADQPLWLSACSTWELSIKWSLGKIALPQSPEQFVASRLQRDLIQPLPVTVPHTLRVASLPALHRDPFDRLLVAQAMVEGLPIVTVDAKVGQYPVETLDAGA